MNRKLKAQFKAAERLGAKYAVIIGDDELSSGVATVKKLDTGEQKEIALENLKEELSD